MTRQRVLSVRIGDAERSAWGASASASNSRWIAQWVRATIAYAIRENKCASVRRASDADPRAVSVIHSLALSLNDETRNAHQIGFVPEGVDEIVRDLFTAARRAAPGRRNPVVPSAHIRQSALINVRLSEEELQHWSDLAQASGFTRAATWVRYTIADLLGISLPPAVVFVPRGLQAIRYDLGGAVTNLSQLRDVAGDNHPRLAEQLDSFGTECVELLSLYREGVSSP